MARSVRLPLEVGVTALFDLALGVLLVPLGLALVAGGLWATWWLGADADEALKLTLGAALVGALGAGYGLRLLLRAWRTRPADLVFDDARLRVDGGSAHGFALDYASIDPARCQLTQLAEAAGVAEITATVAGTAELWRLTVHGRVLAEGDAAEEIDSLREVCAAIRARAPAGEGAEAEEKGTQRTGDLALASAPTVGVLACPQCGAIATPRDAAEVPCAACGAAVAMPDDVRERVRAAAVTTRAQARIARTVDALLDQPGARTTTRRLALSLALIGAAWPLAAWAGVHLERAGTLTFGRGAALAILPLLLVADGYFLSRARLVDRHALGALLIGFGARPPAAPGAPPTCRVCAAPLPDVGATVVRCAFCGAANVTGVDLRALAGRSETSSMTLESALAARAARRRTWRLRTLASAPLFVVTAWILREVVSAS